MPSNADPQTLDILVLTRFSILSNRMGHSWGRFGKPTKLLRKILPKPKPPSLEKKRAYLFDPERLRYRLWTFETFLLASLANQQDRRFRHLVFTSEELPDWCKDSLSALQDRFGFQVVPLDTETHLEEALAASPPPRLPGATHKATMRIDDDDALARTAMADLHAVLFDEDDMIVTWPRGIYLTDRGQGDFAIRRIDRPLRACGLTRVRRSESFTPSIHRAGRHKSAHKKFPVLSLPGEDNFLMTVHPDNVSGRKPRKNDRPVTEEDRALLLERFGVKLTAFGDN